MGENHEKNGKMFLGMVALSLSLFALSCNKETEKDTKAPDEVGTFSVRQLEDDKALLTWTNPGDGDFAGTKLSMSPAIGELAEEKSLKSDVSTFTVTGLTGGQSYTFTIKTFDKSGNISTGKTEGLSVVDEKAPDEVANIGVCKENGITTFSWTNPENSDFAGIKLSMDPPVGNLSEEKILGSDVTSFTLYSVLDGYYTFTFRTFDKSGNVSEGLAVRDQIKDIVAPGEVSDFKVEAENGQAVLTWANPTDSDFAGTKLSMQPAIGQLAQEKVWQAMLPHLQ